MKATIVNCSKPILRVCIMAVGIISMSCNHCGHNSPEIDDKLFLSYEFHHSPFSTEKPAAIKFCIYASGIITFQKWIRGKKDWGIQLTSHISDEVLSEIKEEVNDANVSRMLKNYDGELAKVFDRSSHSLLENPDGHYEKVVLYQNNTYYKFMQYEMNDLSRNFPQDSSIIAVEHFLNHLALVVDVSFKSEVSESIAALRSIQSWRMLEETK